MELEILESLSEKHTSVTWLCIPDTVWVYVNMCGFMFSQYTHVEAHSTHVYTGVCTHTCVLVDMWYPSVHADMWMYMCTDVCGLTCMAVYAYM